MFRMLLASMMALLIASVSAGAALSQEEADDLPKLGIQPVGVEGSYFDLELKPGQKRELTVELSNFGKTEQRVRTYRADVYSRINGGFEAELDGAPTSGATEWLDYDAETLVLDAGETVQRSFTVTIPGDAEPGEYTTSLVIQNADPVKGAGGVAVEQILRQVIAVAITVPGPRQPELEIGAASYQELPAFVSVRVALTNTGNVRLQPTAQFVLADRAGKDVTSTTVDLESIYPGTETFLQVGLVQPLPPGDYVVSLVLKDPERKLPPAEVTRPLVVEAVAVEGTPVVSSVITVESVTIEETRDDSGALQYVEAVVTIQNPSMQVANARLTLHVTRDGESVEDLVLGSSLSFPAGPAEFRQRYVPANGWQPGDYRFSVTLETVDPNTGEAIELATSETAATLTIE